MNEKYIKNVDALKCRNINLYNKIKNEIYVDDNSVAIRYNGNNSYIEILRDKKWWALNSRYDSRYAIEQWIKQFEKIHYKNIFLIFGISNGGYIRALKNVIGKENKIIIYEPSKVIFLKVLYNIDIVDLLEDERIDIYINGLTDEQLMEYIRYDISYELLDYVKISSSPNYFRLFKKEYMNLNESIEKELLYRSCEHMTYKSYGDEIGDNIVKNIWELSKGCTIDSLKVLLQKNIYGGKDIPAIIVAAGPSLDKNIDELTNAKGKSFIIAVDSAVKKMIEHNIIPDVVITVDPHKPLSLFESELSKKIPIVVCGQSRHEIIRQHIGIKFIFASDNFYRYFISKWNKKVSILQTGGSVANDAYSLAVYLGFKTIVFVGLDLAFTDNKKHAENVYKENPIDTNVENNKYTYVKDNQGNDILTFINFKVYKDWFESKINQNTDMQVINATEGGARIEGTIVVTLKDAIQKYCKNTLSVDIAKETKQLFNTDELKEVYDEIINLIDRCDYLKKEFEDGIHKYNGMLKYLKIGENEEKKLNEFLDEIKYINDICAREKLMDIVSLYSKRLETEILEKIYQYNDDVVGLKNTIEYSKQLLQLYSDNIDKIKQQILCIKQNEIDVDIANGYLST